MASYELTTCDQPLQSIALVAAIEQQSPNLINLGFWLTDPLQCVEWPQPVTGHPRQNFLWEQSCYEIFIGVKDQDMYREINLSPSHAWQAYQFEEYRYPEQIPPLAATDIELIQLKKTHYGLNATLDLSQFMHEQKLNWSEIYVGLTAVLKTSQKTYYFAMQHSGPQADFHNKRDWLHQF